MKKEQNRKVIIGNLTEAEWNYIESNKGKLLNPRLDSTFKAIFTQPTEESRAALHSFLEAATESKIDEVSFEPNGAAQQFGMQRNVDYDINVRFSTGESAEIEMQAWQQNYDYGMRAEYQAARLLSTYLGSGELWSEVKKVYQISILDYNYNPKSDEKTERRADGTVPKRAAINYYTMKAQDGSRLSDILNIIFIELPRVKPADQTDEELSKLSLLEKWALFFKYADNLNTSPIVKKITETEVGIMNAQNVLSSISSDRALWLQQYHAEIRERDRLSDLAGAREKAIKEGLAEGMEKGLAEGRATGLAEGKATGLAEGRAEGRAAAVEELKKLLGEGIPLEEALEKVKGEK
ncbi:MAG: PD-(D/E)XK nuclease family transposase [Treponema sp.]|nr:PD-(D/E)XK nuclease family transposase [Treponema sp.]